jgi:hypothetical protein
MEFVGFDTIVDLVNEEILSFYEIENNKIFQKRRVLDINAIDYDDDLGIELYFEDGGVEEFPVNNTENFLKHRGNGLDYWFKESDRHKEQNEDPYKDHRFSISEGSNVTFYETDFVGMVDHMHGWVGKPGILVENMHETHTGEPMCEIMWGNETWYVPEKHVVTSTFSEMDFSSYNKYKNLGFVIGDHDEFLKGNSFIEFGDGSTRFIGPSDECRRNIEKLSKTETINIDDLDNPSTLSKYTELSKTEIVYFSQNTINDIKSSRRGNSNVIKFN